MQVTVDTDNSTPANNKIESENCFESKLSNILSYLPMMLIIFVIADVPMSHHMDQTLNGKFLYMSIHTCVL